MTKTKERTMDSCPCLWPDSQSQHKHVAIMLQERTILGKKKQRSKSSFGVSGQTDWIANQLKIQRETSDDGRRSSTLELTAELKAHERVRRMK